MWRHFVYSTARTFFRTDVNIHQPHPLLFPVLKRRRAFCRTSIHTYLPRTALVSLRKIEMMPHLNVLIKHVGRGKTENAVLR